jgi:hypothetical protein
VRELVEATSVMEQALRRTLPGYVYQAWRRSPAVSALFAR